MDTITTAMTRRVTRPVEVMTYSKGTLVSRVRLRKGDLLTTTNRVRPTTIEFAIFDGSRVELTPEVVAEFTEAIS